MKKKPTKRKAAKKTAAKKAATKKKRPTRKAKATKKSLLSNVDQHLMALATDRYEKIFKSISAQRSRLNEERKLALEIGQRVLQKVRAVQDSLSLAAKSTTAIDLNLLNLLKTGRTTKKTKKAVETQA